MKPWFVLLPLLLGGFRLLEAPTAAPPGERPKNVILLIGDGMGLTQVSAGMFSHSNRLELERFPVTGLITTHSARHLITDSGAGATAFACGCKTYNGAIGVRPDKQPCLTLLEQAESAGMATGLVATCSITHATPAAFVAHTRDRSLMEEIATFFLKNEVDLFIGGGMQYFNERKTDQRDLCRELRAKGYQISDYKEKKEPDAAPSPAAPYAWFSAREEPVSVSKGRKYLPLAARMAPDFLKKRSEKGFFMMLEGSQIDWACHANDGAEAIGEMLDFDAAIGEILRFAEADGQTLVVLTADHETGGMSIVQGSVMDSLELEFNSKGHTATMVPVFAYGPGAKQFSGVYDNTAIHQKIQNLLGFPVPGVVGK